MRLKGHLANLLLALASTLLVLLALELGFRVRTHLHNRGVLTETFEGALEPPPDGPAALGHMIRPAKNRRIVYELEPHLDVEYQGARVTTNGRGFRGVEHPVHAGGDVFRIVGIGDSFMFGQGVGDGELYLARLEAELRRREPGRAWQVINTAVPGYNTVMEVETLKEKGLAYSPDVVLIDFVGNDLSLPNFIRRTEPVLSLGKSFLIDFFSRRRVRNLDLWQRLETRGLVRAPAEESSPRVFEGDPSTVPPEYRDMVGWEAFRAAMAELRRLRDERGFAVVWTSLQPDSPIKRRARGTAEELGFQVCDVGAFFRRYLRRQGLTRDYLRSPLALGPADGHPSPLGHRLTAEKLYDFLQARGLLDRVE